MMQYSVQSRDQISVKGYGFLSFAKYKEKNLGKNIIKNLTSKYCQKLFDCAKKSATDALKTASKRAIQKTAEAAGYLTGNKIDDKITKVSSSLQNFSETVQSKTENTGFYREIAKERYIRKTYCY